MDWVPESTGFGFWKCRHGEMGLSWQTEIAFSGIRNQLRNWFKVVMCRVGKTRVRVANVGFDFGGKNCEILSEVPMIIRIFFYFQKTTKKYGHQLM